MSERHDDGDWVLGGDSENVKLLHHVNTKSLIQGEKTGIRRAGRVIFTSVLILVMVAGFMLWQGLQSQSFPKLAAGIYGGLLRGPADYGGGKEFLLTISEDFKLLKVTMLGANGASYPAQRDVSGYLTVLFPDENLVLKGNGSNQALSGKFEFLNGKRVGNWEIYPLTIHIPPADESFRQWLLQRSELYRIERDIEIAEKLNPVQKQEIEELSRLITDEGAIKERGSMRVAELQARLATTAKELDKKREILKQAQAQLVLAQRVSARGKLVNLGRESLERESRWARSNMVSGSSEDLEAAVARAVDIQALKDALQIEQNLLEGVVNNIEDGRNKQRE